MLLFFQLDCSMEQVAQRHIAELYDRSTHRAEFTTRLILLVWLFVLCFPLYVPNLSAVLAAI